MSKRGPIIMVEDDVDDRKIFSEAMEEMGIKNEIIFFAEGENVLSYLLNNLVAQPFIILCDVNLPKMNGLELKEKIDTNPALRRKSIPFVFFSTSADTELVDKAYEYAVQGYFIKDNTMREMKDSLKCIFTYWLKCRHPNN